MMVKEGCTKIENILNLGDGVFGRGHISQIVKMQYFFKSLQYSEVQMI